MTGGAARQPEYGISAVHYDARGERAERLRIHEIRGSQIGPGRTVSREQVIELIQQGTVIVTTHFAASGKCSMGSEVELVVVNRSPYLRAMFLRSVPDDVPRDHLGRLDDL
jgi:hypothetical protein